MGRRLRELGSAAGALLLASASLACSGVAGSQAPPSKEGVAAAKLAVEGAPPVHNACAEARGLRGRVPRLLAEGKLDRVTRVVAKADKLCPEEASATWDAKVGALAELGRYEEARALAQAINASPGAPKAATKAAKAALQIGDELDKTFPDTPEAKVEMRRLFMEAAEFSERRTKDSYRKAVETYLLAWKAWRPNTQALVGAALAARALGERAEAQRLLDRAIVELERSTGKRLEIDVPNGLPDAVLSIAWSRSAKRLALAHGEVISIFDTVTWRERTKLVGHAGSVRAVAFSPDEQRLASVSHDQTVRLWDAATGALAHSLEGHSDDIDSVAFSPDGRLVASGSFDASVRLWDAKTGAPVRTIRVKSPVSAVAFAPSSDRVAAGSSDGTVRVFNVRSGILARALPSKGARRCARWPFHRTASGSRRGRWTGSCASGTPRAARPFEVCGGTRIT